MSALYAWLGRHPRMVDGVLAFALGFSGIVQAIGARSYLLIPITLGLTVPIVFRRNNPVAAFATAIAAGMAQVLAGTRPVPVAADLSVVVLLYTLAAYTTRRLSLTGLAICLFGSAAQLATLYTRADFAQVPNWLLVGVIVLAGPALIAWAIGDSMRYRRAYYASLEERAARLERDRDAQARIAAAAERARIARELHDVVAHNVSVMVVQADGAAYAIDTDPPRAREALAAISATGRQALAEMRALLGVLRNADDDGQAVQPPALAAAAPDERAGTATAQPAATAEPASLTPMPGIEQLADLLDQTRAAGLSVSCTIEGEPRPLAGGTALAAYRIVQESLTNTRKHAGPLAQASVVLRYSPDALELIIADDGLGGAAACDGAGHGLTGMRERAAMYGGSVRAQPGPRGGFLVTALLPVAPAQAGAA